VIWFNFNTFKIGDEKTFIHLDDDDDDDVGRRRSENFFFFVSTLNIINIQKNQLKRD
jgi:hypothetical protein